MIYNPFKNSIMTAMLLTNILTTLHEHTAT